MERISNIALWLTFAVFIQLQVVDVVLGQTPTRTVHIVSSGVLGLDMTVSTTSSSKSTVDVWFSWPEPGKWVDYTVISAIQPGNTGVWYSLGFQNGVKKNWVPPTGIMTGPRGMDYLFVQYGDTNIPAQHRKVDNESVAGNGFPSLVTTGSDWILGKSLFANPGRPVTQKVTLACSPSAHSAPRVNLAEPVTVVFAYGQWSHSGPIPSSARHQAVVLRQTPFNTTLCPGAYDDIRRAAERAVERAAAEAKNYTRNSIDLSVERNSTRNSIGLAKNSAQRQPFSGSIIAISTVFFSVLLLKV